MRNRTKGSAGQKRPAGPSHFYSSKALLLRNSTKQSSNKRPIALREALHTLFVVEMRGTLVVRGCLVEFCRSRGLE